MFAPSKTMWRDHGNKVPQRRRLARVSPDDVAPVRRVDFELKLRDGYDGPPPRERPRPAAVARREAERAACAAPAAPRASPRTTAAATRWRRLRGPRGVHDARRGHRRRLRVGPRRRRAGERRRAHRAAARVRRRAPRPAARPRAGSPRRDARKETWEPERLERTILARVEERAARSLSGYRYLRCAMFLRSFFGGVGAVSAGQFGALLRAKLGIHVEDADVVRLWVQRFGAKSGEHRLASRHLIVKLTPKDRAGGPAWDANAFADRGAAVSPRERERDVASGETAEQIERLIRDRLDQKMRKLSNFRYQNAYAVFQDDSSSGKAARKAVTREALKERLAAKLDVRLSASQLDALFARYDVEGRGALDVRDLVRRLVPSDFPGASPRREAEKPAKGTKMGALHVPRAARPRPLADPSWTVDDVEALLRSKIAGSRRPLAHYEHQNVYRVFSRAPPDASAPPAKGHANNLTCGRFAAVLEHAFGLALTPPQATRLFLRYDPSGLGRLGVIIPNMLPKDWTPNCGVLPKKPGAAAAPQTSPGRNPLHLVRDLVKVRGLNVGPKHAASWDAAPAVRAR
ncbi:1-acylglycerol-3-phosphate O-acyltransferase [Aureococcus anophagefferens]|nr:1-acylglycerol-3-phosphate O-acyltransferase [Aureococcus anophagefferens]